MRLSLLITSCSFFLQLSLFSQDVTQDGMIYRPTEVMKYMPFNHAIKGGTKQVKYEIESKNKVYVFIKRLDEKGRPTTYHQLLENGEERLIQRVVYNEQDQVLVETNCDKKGRVNRVRTNTWNENGTILGIIVVDGKGEILHKTDFSYDDLNGCLSSIKTYKKGGEKVREIWYHEYFDGCQKSQSILKKGNGKIIREINYACKAEGEISDPKKNETQVCTWDESSPDFLMKVYQTQDDKGHMRRTVQKLNRSDSSLVEIQSFNDNEQMTYRETYDGSISRPIHLSSYHNEQVIYERIRAYQNGQISSQIILQKGRQENKTTYSYDSNGQLIRTETFNKNDKLLRTIQITYN